MKLLSLLEENARLTTAQLALMTGQSEAEVQAKLDEYAAKGYIRGFRAIIDWEKAGRDHIKAFIRIKVTPQPGGGFEDTAEQIAAMPEVDGLYLVSGSYDMSITMSAPSLRDVASFVSNRLSTLGTVIATDTTFVLERYKESGFSFDSGDGGERREFIL